MIDHCWTVVSCGDTFQALARGRGPGCPGLVDTHALGAPRATQQAAEADGWACGLPPDADYAPLTAPPVVAAVPEPVLVPAPEPSRVLVAEPLPELPTRPTKAPARRATAKPAARSK